MNNLTILACAFALGAPLLLAQDAKRAPVLPLTEDPVVGLEKLPKGDALMDKFIEVTGGAEAFKKIKSMEMKGTYEMMGVNASLTMYRATPNLLLSVIDIPGMDKMLTGYDGANAWTYSASMGPAILTGEAADEIIQEATLDENWRDKYTAATTKGTDLVDGAVCYKVELTRKKGAPHTVCFSKDTGLMVKQESVSDTLMGKMTATSVIKDYRKVGDVTLPFKTVVTQMGQTVTMTFAEIKVNTDIPKSKFDPPKEVMELLKR